MIDYCLFSYWQSDYDVATAAADAADAADGMLPALRWLRWLVEASPPATRTRIWIEDRTGIGGRKVWEGI